MFAQKLTNLIRGRLYYIAGCRGSFGRPSTVYLILISTLPRQDTTQYRRAFQCVCVIQHEVVAVW